MPRICSMLTSESLWRLRSRLILMVAGGGERRQDRGQGMVEYALILLFVALVVIVAVQLFGHQVSNTYSNVSNGMSRAGA